MSLSPIFSIIKDLLIVFVVRGTCSGGLLGPKLRDMCKDLLATLFFSPVEVFCLPDNDGEFPLLVEEADAGVLLVVVDVGLELLGVEIWLVLDVGANVGAAGLLFVFAVVLPLLTELTCPN